MHPIVEAFIELDLRSILEPANTHLECFPLKRVAEHVACSSHVGQPLEKLGDTTGSS